MPVPIKLPSTDACELNITTTAVTLQDAINESHGSQWQIPTEANWINMQSKSGSVNFLFDGNTPETDKGINISPGLTYVLTGANLKNLKLVSTSGVAVLSVQIGTTNSDA